ncbi:MAG: carboxymuconolactone decarboxylase family protein [Acidimicrobiia bacterium]|nr:carboxymuconolactone decarboxylase family protein [Acidimicrobiia bacterium]
MTDHDDTHAHGRKVLQDLAPEARALRKMIPGVYEGFVGLSGAAMAPGALDARTKELLALAMAVTLRCDGCIASHARGAAAKGATPEEVAEALGVTLLMSGGPGTVYAPRAFDAFMEYHAAQAERESAAGVASTMTEADS